jgi:L-threonylcarbamoyladenylate synthase
LARLAAEIPTFYRVLIDHFWPGPLTLLFRARPELPHALTAGSGTVGIRIPSHPGALQLVRASGGIITGTSANLSGRPPAATASEAASQLGDGPDLILDGGPTAGGRPSTILGVERGRPVLLREGMVPAVEIRRLLASRLPGLSF